MEIHTWSCWFGVLTFFYFHLYLQPTIADFVNVAWWTSAAAWWESWNEKQTYSTHTHTHQLYPKRTIFTPEYIIITLLVTVYTGPCSNSLYMDWRITVGSPQVGTSKTCWVIFICLHVKFKGTGTFWENNFDFSVFQLWCSNCKQKVCI